MTILQIKNKAVLIGYNPEGKCVYSEIIDISDYYEGEHVWDRSEPVKQLRLQKVRGFLFNAQGILNQEFETIFDLDTGICKSGFARFADGTVRHR